MAMTELVLKDRLNPTQFEAATHIDTPVCILAGAGSGKTRVVTHRIAYLIEVQRARPGSILAVTFTNKAAQEMRERTTSLAGDRSRRVHVGTFHGMAARFLRQFGDAVGVPRSFVIYDSDDSQRLMKRIVVSENNWDKDLVKPFTLKVASWQSEGLAPSDIPPCSWNDTEERARVAYGLYLDRLAGMGAVDFGGLLVKLRDLLNTPAGQEVRDRARHILVDEYQDTNRVQADIILNLAKTADTLCVVGDDDQAIYGWRGATSHNLKRFVDTLGGAQLVRLEDNYRSSARILEAANNVIENNTERLGKTLRPTKEDGPLIRVIKSRDDIDESRKVVASIQDHARRNQSLDDIAILYRANATSRLFEDELRRNHLPYRLIGGVRFYDRKEVKDVLATLRCALNVKSDVDTVRMVSAVPRGVGDVSLRKIQDAAQAERISVLEAMREPALLEAHKVGARARKKCAELAALLFAFSDAVRSQDDIPAKMDAHAAMARAVELSGVHDRLEAEGGLESEGRLENLAALVSAAAQYVEEAEVAGNPTDVIGFLEDAALLSGNEVGPDDDDEGAERVTLMTLHAAKGLEFERVYLVGLEEHSFPHTRALAEDADPEQLEEERRLCYVGITRAKHRLVMTWAQRRMIRGTPRPCRPSRFLQEIPSFLTEGDKVPLFFAPPRPRHEVYVELDAPAQPAGPRAERQLPTRLLDGAAPAGNDAMAKSFSRITDRLRAATGPKTAEPSDEPVVELDPEEAARRAPAQSAPAGPLEIVAGVRVAHETFGNGTVVGLRGRGRLASALVRFDDVGSAPRVIILRHLAPAPTDAVYVVEDI